METVKLPELGELLCINAAEATLLYEDLFRDRSYVKHGIAIRDGDCVFDIGANIGLFSLFASREAAGVRLYTVEPMPPLFEVLSANLRAHHVQARLFQCGISNHIGHAQFAFCERNSAMSGRYWEAGDEQHLAKTILLNKFPELGTDVDELLGVQVEPQWFNCRLRTISDIIAEHRVRRIDLLKVDVEKSEVEVLEGIADRHWGLIRQVALEVHDIDGRVEHVRQLLGRHRFRVTVEQGEFFVHTGLYDIFGIRAGS